MPKAAVLNRQSDIDSSQQLQFTFCYTVFPVFLTCGRIVKSCSRSQPNLTEIWRRPASPGVRCDQIFNSPATQNCTCSFSGNSLDNETTLILIHSLLDSQWKCSNQISIPRANYRAQIIGRKLSCKKSHHANIPCCNKQFDFFTIWRLNVIWKEDFNHLSGLGTNPREIW